MKQYMKQLSMHAKMILYFCIIMFLIVIIPCYYLHQHYCKIFRRSTLKTMEYAVAGNTERLQTLINTIEVAIDCVNDNTKAYKTPDSNKLSTIVDLIVSYETDADDRSLREFTLEKKSNEQFFESLFITALDSVEKGEISCALIIEDDYPIVKYISPWHSSGDGVFWRAENMEALDWYQKTLAKDGEIYWFNEEDHPQRIYMSKLLKYQYLDKMGNYGIRNIGVILVNFDLAWMSKRINMTELTEGSLVLVTDEAGTVFFSNLNKDEITQEEFTYLLKNAKNGVTFDYQHNKKDYLVQKNVLTQGLNIFTFIPDYEIREITRGIVNTNLIMMMVVFFLSIITVSIMSKYLWNPILKLADHMKMGLVEQIEENQTRLDEIGILYRGYNQLQQRIQELIMQAWDNAEEKRKIELQVLQAQINPHFLYNTLGAISCKALLNGQNDIAEQITALSAIVRYNIKEHDALVPLKTELEMIFHYEEIWNMSYGEDLVFYHQVHSNCENILIPKLIIQPLVENAILHGIDFSQGTGKVFIEAEVTPDSRLLIKVANNGNKADVDKLNAYVKGKCTLNADKESIGVKNVCDRIGWYFGEDGELTYWINRDGNTEAVISIRIHSAEES